MLNFICSRYVAAPPTALEPPYFMRVGQLPGVPVSISLPKAFSEAVEP